MTVTEKDGKTKTATHIHKVKLREGKIETEKLGEAHTKKQSERHIYEDTQKGRLKKNA